MPGLISGVHHVSIKCAGDEELRRVVAFYHEVLGLPVKRRWGAGEDAGVMLDAGGTLIEAFANAKDAPGQGAVRHFALATGDVDACARAVEAAGYEVFIQPNDLDIPSQPPLPIRMAFCYGPVGEQIEFFQER